MNQQITEYLKNGEIEKFGQAIAEFYKTLTCGCFFSTLKENYFEEQLVLIAQYQDDDHNFWFNLSKGFILGKCKKENEAYKYLSKAISIDVSHDLPHSLRSGIDSTINRMSKEDANLAVVLNPSARNFFVLAHFYGESNDEGDIKQAILYYEKAIELNSNFACAHNNMANKLKKIKNFDRAIFEYKNCIELDRNHWAAYYSLWRLLDDKKEYEEAYRIAKLGYKIHPNLDYKYALGIANYHLNKYSEAIVLLEGLESISALSFLAHSFKRLNDFDRAIVKFKKCIELDLNHLNSYYNLFKILFNRKEYDDVNKFIQKCIEINHEYIYKLGVEYLELNKYTEARIFFEKYIEYSRVKYNSSFNNVYRATEKLKEAKIKQPFLPLLQEAIEKFNNSNYSETILILEKYLNNLEYTSFNDEHNLVAQKKLKESKSMLLFQEAIQMFENNNFTEAISLFEKYIKEFPLENRDNRRIALNKLKEAKTMEPIQEALQKLENKNYTEAIELLENFIKNFPVTNVENENRKRDSLRKYSSSPIIAIAKRKLIEAKHKQPFNHSFQEAIQKFEDSNYIEAIQLFEKYLQNFKDFNQVHNSIAGLKIRYAKQKLPFKKELEEAIQQFDDSNYTVAIQLFEKYLEEFKDFNTEHNLIVNKKLQESKQKQPFKKELEEAIQQFNDSNYTAAIQLFEEYLVNFKNFNTEHNLIVNEKLEEAIQKQPFKKELEEAIQQFNDSNYTAAIQLFEEYLVNFKNFNTEHNLIVNEKLYEAKLKQAMKFYETANNSEAVSLFENYLDTLHLFDNDNKLRQEMNKPRPLSDIEIDAYLDCLYEDYYIPYDNSFYSYYRRNGNLWKHESSMTFNFGKYKGESLGDIISKDTSYVIWCIFNINSFSISKKVLINKKLRDHPNFLDALAYVNKKENTYDEWQRGYAERADAEYSYNLMIEGAESEERSMDEDSDDSWRDL